MKLNLFSSDGLHPDFLNVDRWTPPNAESVGAGLVNKREDGTSEVLQEVQWQGRFMKADLSKRFPWADGTIAEIRAYDGPEHVSNKIQFMNECHRVLEAGGLLDIQVPDASEGDGGDCDPTHVSRWNRSSFEYFTDQDPHLERFREAYGVTARFTIESMARRKWDRKLGGVVWIINARLRAVK